MRRTLTPILCMLVLLLTSCSPGQKAAQLSAGQPTPTPSMAVPPPTGSTMVPTPVAAEPPPGSVSDQLIEAALERGEIDQETALTYKVYAQFSDQRLPGQYQGAVNLRTDSHILDQLEAVFTTLSPQAQHNLAPYLMPPVYAGAWGPPAGSGDSGVVTIKLPCEKIETDKWDSTSAMHSPVRFWWLKSRPDDASIANSFMTAMDDKIWPRLTTLMGRTPLPDGEKECNGDGPAFDIYITPQVARSYAAANFPPGCRETPSYIVMNPAVSDAILAHEFMHAIQWSYNTSADCMYPGNYAWMAEATASWAQDYVYPDSNEEHAYVPWFYDNNGASDPPALDLRNDQHEYGANIFFFYLTHHFDNPGLVRTAWDNTTSMKSVDAVDKAIPGGLDAVWGDFAIANIVEPPRDEYQVWDNLNVKPSSSSLQKDYLSPNNFKVVADKINRLAIKYQWFTFADDARLVTWYNGLTYQLDDEPINTYVGILPINDGSKQYKFTPVDPKDVKWIKVQAYFKVAGDTDWQVEDWTDKPYVSFCRDAAAEKLTDLIVVTSSSSQEFDNGASGKYKSTLEAADIGCWRYGGNASLQFTGSGEGGAFTDQQTIPNVAFERTEVHPNIPYPILHFKVVEGQMNRTYDYKSTDGECVGNGEGNPGLGPQTSSDLFVLYGLEGKSNRRYSGEANTKQPVTVDFHCPDGNTASDVPPQPFFYTDVLSQILNKVYTVPNGGVLDGSDDMLRETDGAHMMYQWHLEPLAEPAGSGSASNSGSSVSKPPSGSASSGGDSGTSPGQGDGNFPGLPGQTGGLPVPGSTQSPGQVSLPGIPDYPNVEFAQQPAPGSVMIMTSDTAEQVAQFYRDRLTSQGWTEMPSQNNPELFALAFSKDDAVISIVISSQEGQTSFMISLTG